MVRQYLNDVRAAESCAERTKDRWRILATSRHVCLFRDRLLVQDDLIVAVTLGTDHQWTIISNEDPIDGFSDSGLFLSSLHSSDVLC